MYPFSGRRLDQDCACPRSNRRQFRARLLFRTSLSLFSLIVFSTQRHHLDISSPLPPLTGLEDISQHRLAAHAGAQGTRSTANIRHPGPIDDSEPQERKAESSLPAPTSFDRPDRAVRLAIQTSIAPESLEMAPRPVPTSIALRDMGVTDFAGTTMLQMHKKAVAGTDVGHQRGLKNMRLVAVHAGILLGGTAIFKKFQNIYGGVAQPFRLGNDWKNDRAAGFDELLHFQGSYRMAQSLADFYRWGGMPDRKAELVGAAMTLTAMTFLEYLDGRRANDYASYSDLAANVLGVTFAYLKPRLSFLHPIDFRVSYQSVADPFHTDKLVDYDRMTQWIMLDLSKTVDLPLELGLGYSVKEAFTARVRSELYLGIGFSLSTLLRLSGRGTPELLRVLDVYHFGVRKQIL